MISGGSKIPVPWDILVIVTITMVGLGYSVKKLSIDVSPPRTLTVGVSQPVKEDAFSENQSLGTNSSSSHTIDLGCIESKLNNQRIEAENGMLRFKGRVCNTSKDFGGVSVTNLTTGLEGTVFFQGLDNAFITDKVLLKKGKNVIRIEWKESAGLPTSYFLADVYSQ